MKAFFLAVSFCLVAVLQAQDLSPLALNNGIFSGKWFMKALVMQDQVPLTKVSPILIWVLSNGDMELSLTHMIYGQCLEVTTILEKTEVPGQYRAFEGKSHLRVQLSSMRDHFMLYCDGELDGLHFTMTQLMGRDPKENLEALEEFKEFTRQNRLALENLVIPEQMEECKPEGD